MEIRFRPNTCASMDQAPGPISESADATAAARSRAPRSPMGDRAIQICSSATSIPATGVQSPTRRRIPAAAAPSWGTALLKSMGCGRSANASQRRNVETASRRSISPLPGQPFAKVEKSRCRVTFYESTRFKNGEKPSSEFAQSLFRVIDITTPSLRLSAYTCLLGLALNLLRDRWDAG
jgi:hypothetical protein